MAGFKDALKEIEKFTPEDGYNVVGVDPHEPAGEALYLVAHVYDAKEAETRRSVHETKTGDRTYVYGPKEDN